MEKYLTEGREIYFPAVICAEYDSPIDALVGLHVPQDEAMDLVTAAWADGCARCVLARVDGGRHVVAILLPNGHWAACNAFVGQACATPREAERRLKKLTKRGRQGTVGTIPVGRTIENAGS
ncbi:hypothetical protein AGMMS50256_04720 [Betaproteobacteria bacterium]|nr:hypothetical protein AGMMS50256_04720 [Betaproteobacteria bacterium]